MPEHDGFSQAIAAMARELRSQPDMQTTLQSAVDLAAAHLRGRGEVSVTLASRGKFETPASTGARAEQADTLQYQLGEGPCVDAVRFHETFQIEDLAADQHYPNWSRAACAKTGFRGVVAYQLFTDTDSFGALNLYTDAPRPFETIDRVEGLLFATHAAIALKSARTEQQLNSGLLSRNLIGQAQGILMERFGLTPQRAFEFLARISQDGNIKLIEVAQRLVDDRSEA